MIVDESHHLEEDIEQHCQTSAGIATQSRRGSPWDSESNRSSAQYVFPSFLGIKVLTRPSGVRH